MKQPKQIDAVIVGGGPAGLAAAVALFDHGIENIIILEREAQLGGILRQCIHDGFGLTRFSQTLSGPEYAQPVYRCGGETPYPLSAQSFGAGGFRRQNGHRLPPGTG